MNRPTRTRRGRGTVRRLPLQELRASADERLADLVMAGDDTAFEVLFDRHVANALWFAREALGTWEEAEEAVRHSFAAAHAYLATRADDIEFAPWLHTILSNHCLSMLQARTPGPRRPTDTNVVDLDAWRERRRNLLGATLPVAPSAGLREGVMAACGIGANAASVGTPLLGGTLAKVAVVAVLAGSTGVAGPVVPDRMAQPNDGAVRATVVDRKVDVAAPSSLGASSVSGSPSYRTARPGAMSPKPDSVPPSTGRERRPRPRAQAPAESPSGSVPQVGEDPPSPTSPPRLDQSTVERVVAVVDDRVPVVVGPSKSALAEAVGLAKEIGDDLGVVPAKPPVDVRALLSQRAVAPAK